MRDVKMARYYDLPVFQDVYRLILSLFAHTKDFPREYKYTLGQDMKCDGINLVRSIFRANKATDKTDYLEEFLDNFEVLNLAVRQYGSRLPHNAYHQRQLTLECPSFFT